MATTATYPATGGSLVSGTLTATGSSTSAFFSGWFVVTLAGTWSGTVLIERAYDGTNFVTASIDGAGTAASYTGNVSVVLFEPLKNIPYRVTFTRVSGTLTVDIRQTTDVQYSPGPGGTHM